MPTVNFRTSSLFHYTSYESLKKILQDGINPNYCKEDFSYEGKEYVVGIPMVSFCDIPLMRAHVFTARYGRHAIGLSKSWALRNSINPILYISNNEMIDSLKFYKSYEMHLKQKLSDEGIGNLLTIDPHNHKSVSLIVPYINHANSHSANLNFFGYAKKYMGHAPDGKEQCNYEENEWRYIVKENEGLDIKWKWSKAEYDAWRGEGNKPAPTASLIQKKLTFDVSDITHIVVEQEQQIAKIVKHIGKLTKVGGSDREITDDEQKILYSKIISVEKIKSDF